MERREEDKDKYHDLVQYIKETYSNNFFFSRVFTYICTITKEKKKKEKRSTKVEGNEVNKYTRERVYKK